MADDEPYANIREILGELVGQTILDISQHDKEEFDVDGRSYVVLLFTNGATLKFYVGDDPMEYTGVEKD